MPSIYQLKSRFQGVLRPLVNGLARAGVTANQVTLSAVALSCAGGAAIALWPAAAWPYLLLPPLLFLRMALNAIDGMLAREHAQQSKLGAILNELGDVVSDAALYLPFAYIAGAWAVVVVVLAIFSEMAGVVAVQIGASRRYDGPMGKSDRAFVFGALGLLVGIRLVPAPWIDYILAAMIPLLAYTVFNRARNALREMHG